MAFTQRQMKMRPLIDADKNISNFTEVLDSINEETDEDFLNKFLSDQKHFLETKSSDINAEQLNQIINAIEIRLSAIKNQSVTNKSTLEAIQRIRPDFKSLSIISTKKEDNDSKKDIELIRWYEEGMEEPIYLECYGKSTINDYLQLHPDFIEKGSPKDLFDYYKDYVHKELKKENTSDISATENQKQRYDSDPEIQAIKEYAKSQNIDGDVIVYNDTNGEKYYNVGDKTYKFRTNVYGKREIYLADNLENKEKKPGTETEETVKVDSVNPEGLNGNYTTDFEYSIELKPTQELLKRYISGEAIDEESKKSLAKMFQTLISETGIDNLDRDTIDLLDAYILFIEDKKSSEGILEEEQTTVSKYHDNINRIAEEKAKEEAVAKENHEVKVLTKKKTENNEKGNVLTIILIIGVLIIGTVVATIAILK